MADVYSAPSTFTFAKRTPHRLRDPCHLSARENGEALRRRTCDREALAFQPRDDRLIIRGGRRVARGNFIARHPFAPGHARLQLRQVPHLQRDLERHGRVGFRRTQRVARDESLMRIHRGQRRRRAYRSTLPGKIVPAVPSARADGAMHPRISPNRIKWRYIINLSQAHGC